MGATGHSSSFITTTGKVIWLVVSAIALLLYGGALLSPTISPLRTQVPAFLNLAFPVLLAVVLILLLATLLFRLWRIAIAYLLLLVLSAGYIHTYFPLRLSGDDDTRDLRIVTYNVANFELRDDDGIPGAIRLLLDSDADIICLQESASPETIRGYGSVGERLLTTHPHRLYHADDRLLLLSRYPILADDVIDYKSYANGSAWYLLRLPDERTLLLVNNHMESYSLHSDEKETFRSYLTTPSSLEETKSRLLTIKRRLGPSMNIRADASHAVRQTVSDLRQQYHPDYTVVGGDLNDTPKSYTYTLIRDDRHDAFVDAGQGIGISFNEPLYSFRIDHLFYEGSLDAVTARIPRHRESSDHNPLIVDFALHSMGEAEP